MSDENPTNAEKLEFLKSQLESARTTIKMLLGPIEPESMHIYVGVEMLASEALGAITDEWIEAGNCSHQTIMDLRNFAAKLFMEEKRHQEECNAVKSNNDYLTDMIGTMSLQLEELRK